jgi:hypothetical protein
MGKSFMDADTAYLLKAGLDAIVEELEKDGFTRGQIGTAMAGTGLQMAHAALGTERTLGMMQAAHDAMTAQDTAKAGGTNG